MNKCPNCDVNVYESEIKCPLCDYKFENNKRTNVQFPSYNYIIKNRSSLKNVPVFITFVVIVICCYINFFTYDTGDVLWSLIVAISCVLATAIIRLLHTKSLRFGSKVVMLYFSVSVFLFFIDMLTGPLFWATNYAIPLFTVVVTLYLTVLTVKSRQKFAEYFGNLLTVCIFSFTPILIYFSGYSNLTWGFLISGIFSCIIVLALYLFSDRSLKQELKKRFHR